MQRVRETTTMANTISAAITQLHKAGFHLGRIQEMPYGWRVTSLECDRACFNHPNMEVEIREAR